MYSKPIKVPDNVLSTEMWFHWDVNGGRELSIWYFGRSDIIPSMECFNLMGLKMLSQSQQSKNEHEIFQFILRFLLCRERKERKRCCSIAVNQSIKEVFRPIENKLINNNAIWIGQKHSIDISNTVAKSLIWYGQSFGGCVVWSMWQPTKRS